MTIQYHIYANNGAGGPVDYTTPIGTTALLTFTPPAVAPSSDTTWAVRAFDTVTGLEEANVDARVRLVVDSAGNDLSALPGPPAGLMAYASAPGAVSVAWIYPRGGRDGLPLGFHVYIGNPTPNYAAAAATIPYRSAPAPAFRATLTGLANAAYQIGVRAYNAIGEEKNTVVVAATVAAAGPRPVEDLAAAPYPAP